MVVVGAVPEHGSGRSSPRARQWSGPSLSTRHAAKKQTPLVLLFGVFIYLLILSSPNVHVWSKKQTGIARHTVFLPFLANSRLAPVKRCISVGPSDTSNEEARTLITKGRVYWRRSRGCESNRVRHVRTSPKNLGRMKRRNSWLFII